MSPEWPPEDPLFDRDDPAAVEREERRREREAKRQQREAKRGKKDAPAPPPPKAAAPPATPRTPEQEFWDEDPEPTPPVPGQAPVASAASQPAEPDPGMVERGRRRLLGRRRSKDAATPPGESAPPEPAPPIATPLPKAPPAADPSGSPAGAPAPKPAPAASRPSSEAPAATPSSPAGEPKTEIQPQVPPEQPVKAPVDPDKPQVDPAGSGAAPSPVPVATPSGDATASPQGDSLGKAAIGGAAAAGLAGGAAAEGPGTHEYAPPPAPPEPPTAADFAPLVRDWDFHDEGDPDMTGAARVGKRRGEDGGKRRGGPAGALLRHPFRILAAIVVILILLFLNSLFQPFHGGAGGRVEVKIPKGSGVGEVGDILERRGIIDGSYLGIVNASTLFQIRVTLDGKRGDLIAGRHTMHKGMSYSDAISALSEEPSAKAKPGIVTVTIPEGYHRTETAKLVAEDGLKGSYVKATKKSKLLNPAQYGGKGAKNLEGFLFPDTWELKSGTPVKKLVALQLEDFKKQIKKVNMKYARSKNLTIYDVVTIGSLIEGEAGLPKQRKLVASVIYNRLHEGMTLGLDTTIRFATGNYAAPLTQTQLETSSPYNTRTNAGLPPGPISSPGLAALQAAAHPAKTGYLFYVNDPNSCGGLTFSKSEEEFEADVEKYEAAREKAGGNAPSTCGE